MRTREYLTEAEVERLIKVALIGDDIVPQMMVNLLGISAEQRVFELTPLV
jgi:hypothetical protein